MHIADVGYQQWLAMNRALIAANGSVNIKLGMTETTVTDVASLDKMAETVYPIWLQSYRVPAPAAPSPPPPAAAPIPQPMKMAPAPSASARNAPISQDQGWHETLFGCSSDFPICMKAYFCQCLLYGEDDPPSRRRFFKKISKPRHLLFLESILILFLCR